MPIRVCVAGVTGWAGSAVARGVLGDARFELTGAISRGAATQDVGPVLGLPAVGLAVTASLAEALARPADVLIDYTEPTTVKARTLAALDAGVHVVVGTSGLTAADYAEIAPRAEAAGLGVIAAGNFSITAALAKHFALVAARYLPTREIIDYASAGKPDAPSGTVQELAEALHDVSANRLERPIAETLGTPAARGAAIGGTQVHSLRLPGFVIAFETIFGLPDERLLIRHDAGAGAEPYVGGTLLAAEKVMALRGLVRGLDTLLFGEV